MITLFLWLPVSINNEARWLERASIEQVRVLSHSGDPFGAPTPWWRNDRWVNQVDTINRN